MNLPPIPLDRVRCYPTREAWLAGRAAGEYPIGASEIAAVLGISPWSSPWDLWMQRRGGAAKSENVAMSRGRKWEGTVLCQYAEETGLHVCSPAAAWSPGRSSLVVVHGTRDWMRWSPDALVYDREWGGVEAKTAQKYEGWESGEIGAWTEGCEALVPPCYAVQGYWALEVSGLPWIDIVALLPYYELRRVRLHRDPEIQAAIAEQVSTWRERHLVRGEPPEVDGSPACARYLAGRYIQLRQKRDATPEEVELMEALARAHAQERAAALEKRRLRNELSSRAQGKVLWSPRGTFKPRDVPAPESGQEWDQEDELDFTALVRGPRSTT